jgi:hypothetical protein
MHKIVLKCSLFPFYYYVIKIGDKNMNILIQLCWVNYNRHIADIFFLNFSLFTV